MQILTGKSIPRRTFLRGMGATVALPYLDAMTPAFSALGKAGAAAAATNKTRLVCIESVHGARRLEHVGRVEEPLGTGRGRPRLRAQSPTARCRRSSHGGSI